MPRKPYTRYSREFKLEAVRQAALGEKPKAQIARALGIRVGHLRDWRLQFEEEARTGVTHPPPVVGQDLEQEGDGEAREGGVRPERGADREGGTQAHHHPRRGGGERGRPDREEPGAKGGRRRR